MFIFQSREIKNKIRKLIESKFNIKEIYETSPIYFTKISNSSVKNTQDEYWRPRINKVNSKFVFFFLKNCNKLLAIYSTEIK